MSFRLLVGDVVLFVGQCCGSIRWSVVGVLFVARCCCSICWSVVVVLFVGLLLVFYLLFG